jgi:hypothetical protein
MGSLSAGQITLLIVGGLAAAGVIISLIRSRATFAGYHDLAEEVGRLKQAIGGDVFRDGSDVVVAGTYYHTQCVVRFSNAEHTPGVNIRMPAAATFQLSVAHAGARVGSEGGRILVRTGNGNFDHRFATRTDHPTEAKLFLQSSAAEHLQKLACSNNTLVSISKGTIELSELVIPMPNTCSHVLEHLESMSELAERLRAMPGSDRVKLVTFKRERQVAGRIAIAVGVVVALGSVFAATKVPSQPAFSEVNATMANGIPPADALLVRDAQRWRVAGANDLDATAAAWLSGHGQQAAGRIEADFSGMGSPTDVAYLLIGPDGRRRIVIVAQHTTRLDGEMVDVGLIARVRKNAIPDIQWKGGKAPEDILGDGLLVVQGKGDTQSSVVFFLKSSGTVSGAPADYQQISLPPS